MVAHLLLLSAEAPAGKDVRGRVPSSAQRSSAYDAPGWHRRARYDLLCSQWTCDPAAEAVRIWTMISRLWTISTVQSVTTTNSVMRRVGRPPPPPPASLELAGLNGRCGRAVPGCHPLPHKACLAVGAAFVNR
jgi:hypothetical protein